MTGNGSPFCHVHVNVVTSTSTLRRIQTMKKLAILAALVLKRHLSSPFLTKCNGAVVLSGGDQQY